MSRAGGWWRHLALAGTAAGLLAAPAVPAPAGWAWCLGAAAAALAAVVGAPARSIRRGPRRRAGAGGDRGFAPPNATIAARLAALLALAVLAGLGLGGLRLAAIAGGALRAPDGARVSARGFVAGFPQRGFGEVRVPLATAAGRVLVVAPEPVPDLRVGTELRVSGTIATPEAGFARSRVGRAGAAVELRAERLRSTGAARGGLAGVLDAARGRAEDALGADRGIEQAALARGFVLGEDDRIEPATREAFRRAGLAHLLAVSGQNVILLAILGGAILALFGAGLRMRLALTLLLIAAYVPIAGAGPSIQRAGVMGAAAIAATLAGRPSQRAYALLLAAVVTLAIDPRAGADPGWQLSFAAVAGIIVWGRPLRATIAARLPRRLPRRLAGPLAEGVALTVAATVATAPLIAHSFERVSVAALPANVAVLPAIAPVMWIGMAIAILAQLPAAMTALGPIDPIAWLRFVEARLIDYVAAVADVFAAPRWAQVEVALPGVAAPLAAAIAAAAALSVLVAAAGRRERLRLPRAAALGAALAVLLALVPALLGGASGADRPPAGALRITELDVGQGDATLLEPGAGAPVLVDGGPPGSAAADRLAALGIERLAAVVVTHDELDHAGGLAAVLDRFEVGELVHARPAPELQAMARGAGVPIKRVAAGSTLRFGRLELAVLWPPRDHLSAVPPDRNADAIVLVAGFGGWRALLSADAEQELTGLDPGPLDVLKVAHHGSDDAGLGPLLERSLPRVALIGVGAGNPYGHPTEATIATLAEHDVCTLRTDRDGSATVELDRDGLSARTEAGPVAELQGCAAAGS